MPLKTSSILILMTLASLVLTITISCINAWEDDYHYFTSFRDVKEWAKMYPKQCSESNSNERRLSHLSPIPLPKSSKAKRPKKGSRALWIYNNAPPKKGSYSVQYGFPNNKECIESSFFNPCFISPSFGLVRAVVLAAEREKLTQVRRDFKIQQPEQFVTLKTGIEGVAEKKFYEAVFLGTTDCATSKKQGRRTHTIDGKSYPMEINMYFVDESLPVMAQTVILVVLVEQQEEDNDQVKPVVKAVHNHLEKLERQMLFDVVKNNSYGRQRTFHHMGKTTAFTNHDGQQQRKELNSTAELFRNYINIQEEWEKVQTLSQKTSTEEDKRAACLQWLKYTANSVLKNAPLDILKGKSFYQNWLYPAVFRALGYDNNTFVKNLTYPAVVELDDLKTMRKRLVQPLKPLEDDLKNAVKSLIDLKDEAKKHTLWVEYNPGKKPKNCKASTIGNMKRSYLKRKEDNQKLNDAFLIVANLINKLTEGKYSVVNNETGERNETEFDRKRIEVEGDIASLRNLFTYKNNAEKVDKRIGAFHIKSGFKTREEAQEKIKTVLDNRKELFFAQEETDQTKFKILDYNAWSFKKIGPVEGGNLGLSDHEFHEVENASPIKSYLQSEFQISWLLPHDGGYYIYQGTSSVPPCYEAETVLVFKKPIKMSKSQIKILTTIPTTHRKNMDITSTLPLLHKLRKGAPDIMFEKRNHLFLHDDTVHKSAINSTDDSSGNYLCCDATLNLIAFIGALIAYAVLSH